MPQPTKTERKHRAHLLDLMRQLEWDIAEKTRAHTRLPPEWQEIGVKRYPDRKRRITLRVEESVIRFFKSMGAGYQVRMNDVLASWVHARLAGYAKGPEDVGVMQHEARPELGESELFIAQLEAHANLELARYKLALLGTTEEELIARLDAEVGVEE